MGSLKKDIEGVLRSLEYTIKAPSSNKGTEFTVSVDVSDANIKKIRNLVESVADKIIGVDTTEDNLLPELKGKPYGEAFILSRNSLRKEQRDIKSKLIGKE